MKTFGVIMAGGGGTRFWPLSRNLTPKQLLNLSGKEIMVNETADRLNRVIPKDNVYVITNVSQADKIKIVMAGRVKPSNVIGEPSARNTSACIGYSAVKIIKEHGDGIMVVSPADAYIKDEDEYARVLSVGISAAENSNGIITIGIKPTFPATGYGYIEFENENTEVKKVKRFVEKPDIKTAQEYFNSGKYAWNSGVFIFKASTILKKFEQFLPDIYKGLIEIKDSLGTADEEKTVNGVYPNLRSISVDYGIMEKAQDIFTVSGDFGWNDVGSWDMLGVLNKEDKNGNVIKGDVISIDTINSVVYSSGRTVATVGISNLVVVETPDAVLVCPKDKSQDVKKIVEQLKAEGKKELL